MTLQELKRFELTMQIADARVKRQIAKQESRDVQIDQTWREFPDSDATCDCK
jgi:hypothetical protein